MGFPLRAYLKIRELHPQHDPLKRIGEIDCVVILALYDIRHIFKQNTEVKKLCFCANAAFEDLFFNAESYKCRDDFVMSQFM